MLRTHPTLVDSFEPIPGGGLGKQWMLNSIPGYSGKFQRHMTPKLSR